MAGGLGIDYVALELAKLSQAEYAFKDFRRRATELFSEQDAGTRAEGAVTFVLEIALTNEGNGAVKLDMKSSTKEPKVKMLPLRVHDGRGGMVLFTATQEDLPHVTPIRKKGDGGGSGE